MSGGALDWLDSLTTGITNVAGKAVDVVGSVVTAKANLNAAKTGDTTPAWGSSVLQSGSSSFPTMWIVAGLAVVVGGFLLLRKR